MLTRGSVAGLVVLLAVVLNALPASAQQAGQFSGELSPGVNLTSYSGGSVDSLPLAAPNAESFFVAVAGEMIGYVAGAPGFVNADFVEHFAGGVPANTPMLVLQAMPYEGPLEVQVSEATFPDGRRQTGERGVPDVTLTIGGETASHVGDGRYRFTTVEPGTHQIVLSAPGWSYVVEDADTLSVPPFTVVRTLGGRQAAIELMNGVFLEPVRIAPTGVADFAEHVAHGIVGGYDWFVPPGTAVYAAVPGEVTVSRDELNACGGVGTTSFVVVRGVDGRIYNYQHIERRAVAVGDQVGYDDVVAFVQDPIEDPCNATAPHIHVGVVEISGSSSAECRWHQNPALNKNNYWVDPACLFIGG